MFTMLQRILVLLVLVTPTAVFSQEQFSCMTITAVSPSAGSVGTRVTITSADSFGFDGCCNLGLCSRASVYFDGIPATILSYSLHRIVVIAPPHQPGTVALRVQQLNGGANTSFTYVSEVPTVGITAMTIAMIAVVVIAIARLR